VPGHCPRCQVWEGEHWYNQPTTEHAKLSENVLRTSTVEAFLAQLSSPSISVDVSILQRNLCRCIEVCTGNRFAFLRVCGLSERQRLRKPDELVSLQDLISVAIRLDLSIYQFFEQDKVACEEAWRHAASMIDQSVTNEFSVHSSWTKERLAEVATETPPPSLATVAKRYGYTTTAAMRRRAPDLCEAITLNYLGAARSREQKCAIYSGVSSHIEIQPALDLELSKDGPSPIENVGGGVGLAESEPLQDMAPEICKKANKNRSEQRKREILRQRAILSLALDEEPAPSPGELRVRLDLPSGDRISSVHEDLCSSLYERYRHRLAKERSCVRSLIEDRLRQPNPSWANIAQETGLNRSVIMRRFPDLYTKARILCKETGNMERKADFNAAEIHVRQVVERLGSRGIHPSIRRVFRAVPKGHYLGITWIERILRTIPPE
jgi:AraC-like DNA-binding protein